MKSVCQRSILTATFAVVLATALLTQPVQAAPRNTQSTLDRPAVDRSVGRVGRAVRPVIRKVLKPLGDILLPKG
ncbi:MAG TPA: hypothetical protein VNM92_08510 [Thermoanaerobaculia bacterium]|nr:hypothetical protein [Thermoanaerobaculia bacterium]